MHSCNSVSFKNFKRKKFDVIQSFKSKHLVLTGLEKLVIRDEEVQQSSDAVRYIYWMVHEVIAGVGHYQMKLTIE